MRGNAADSNMQEHNDDGVFHAGKSGAKRKRPVKETVIEPVEEAPRRVTRRATRSQDTS